MKQDALDAVTPLRGWVLEVMTLHIRGRSLINPNTNPCTDFFSHERNLWFSMLDEDEPFRFPFLLIPSENHTKVEDAGILVRPYGPEVSQIMCFSEPEEHIAYAWHLGGELDSLMTETRCVIRACF